MTTGHVDSLIARVRGRARTARAAAVTPWAFLGGAAAFAALRLSSVPSPTAALYGVGAALLLVAVATSVWGLFRPLTAVRVARLVDQRLGQMDRFATVVELGAAEGRVIAALRQDAAARAASISPADAVPLRWSRPAVVGLVAALGVALAAQQLAAPPAGSTAAAAPEPITVDRVLELAEVAEAAAEKREDEHMAAVAAALAELAEEAASRNENEVTDLARLGELVSTLERLMSPLGSTATRSARADAGQSDPGALSEAMAALEQRLERIATQVFGMDTELDPETFWLEGDRIRQGEIMGDAPDLSRPAGASGSEAPAGMENAQAVASEEAPQDLSSGFIVGASSDSSVGDSSMAGQGAQDLFGDETVGASIWPFEAIGVSGEDDDEGRRVNVELAPEASETQGAEGTFALADWLPSSRPLSPAGELPFRYRSVAGGYFLPSQETANR